MSAPWRIDGPVSGPEHPDLESALRALHTAERRRPTESDAPPPSTFPMTPAARAALNYSRESARPVSKRRKRELTYGKQAASEGARP